MATMQRYPFLLAAIGSTKTMVLQASGTRFMLERSDDASYPPLPLDVRLDVGGVMQSLMPGQGYAGQRFNQLTVTNLDGTFSAKGFVVVSDDEYVDKRAFNGEPLDVVMTDNAPPRAGINFYQRTVTNASVLFRNATTTHKYLAIQNNGAGTVYVQCGSAADPTLFQIKPGQTWEPAVIPTQDLYWIGSIASNPDVVLGMG